jgi:hypothetical protein
MGASVAHASDDPDPLGDLLHQVTKATAPVKQSGTTTTPSQDAPDPPVSDSDSPGHETRNPSAPDHAAGQVGHVELGGADLADVSGDRSTVNDDDSTRSDSTLLAVGGQEIIGAHADSQGQQSSHGGAPEIPACDQTDGKVCLDLLYSDATASDHGTDSRSASRSGLANLCLGGDDPTGDTCDSGAAVDLAGTSSSAHRNQTTGRTTAQSSSGLANVCVQRDPVTHQCTVTADAVSSNGQADSDGEASRSSQVLGLGIAGNPAGVPTDPFTVSVPPDCTSPSVLCLFGNQGETYLQPGLAGTAQTALDLSALDGTVTGSLAHTETLVHDDGGEAVVEPPTTPGQPTTPAHPRPAAHVDDGILPNTGGVWSGLLGIGLLLFGLGAVATAWDRRRVVAV